MSTSPTKNIIFLPEFTPKDSVWVRNDNGEMKSKRKWMIYLFKQIELLLVSKNRSTTDGQFSLKEIYAQCETSVTDAFPNAKTPNASISRFLNDLALAGHLFKGVSATAGVKRKKVAKVVEKPLKKDKSTKKAKSIAHCQLCGHTDCEYDNHCRTCDEPFTGWCVNSKAPFEFPKNLYGGEFYCDECHIECHSSTPLKKAKVDIPEEPIDPILDGLDEELATEFEEPIQNEDNAVIVLPDLDFSNADMMTVFNL